MNNEVIFVLAKLPTIFWILVMMMILILAGRLDKYV
jgi:hypothetical protein